jgi:hypothetical protein
MSFGPESRREERKLDRLKSEAEGVGLKVNEENTNEKRINLKNNAKLNINWKVIEQVRKCFSVFWYHNYVMEEK